jgi:hypothetical protein
MSDTPHEPDGVDELASVAGELKGSIDALSKSFDVLAGKTKFNRVMAILMAITIVVLGVVINNVSNTSHRLQNTVRQNAATEQELRGLQSKALCPLYLIFINAIEHPAPTSRITPDIAKSIKDGYAALKCT